MFTIEKKSKTNSARLGKLQTKHGVLETPAYALVATHGEVRTLSPEDLQQSPAELLISNTFHIWQDFSDEGLKDYKGVHNQLQWQKPVITDSGGFQVFSYGAARTHNTGKVSGKETRSSSGISQVEIDEDGVSFLVGDKPQRLDAEKSIALQEKIGADIIVAFDEPTSPHHDRAYTEKSLERTHRWAKRSLDAKKSDQLIYGVTQGGSFEDLRQESAKHIGAMQFDGFGIGGCFSDSFGSSFEATQEELKWTLPFLPENKPRHLLGIGKVSDVIHAVEAGIDTVDCVIPTREARHGRVWTYEGQLDLKKSSSQKDDRVIEKDCPCEACKNGITRSQIRAYFKTRDPQAGRLATLHNIEFFNQLMRDIRASIVADTWNDIRNKYAVYL